MHMSIFAALVIAALFFLACNAMLNAIAAFAHRLGIFRPSLGMDWQILAYSGYLWFQRNIQPPRGAPRILGHM